MSRQARQQREDTFSPPPPLQTALATEAPDNTDETAECPPPLPEKPRCHRRINPARQKRRLHSVDVCDCPQEEEDNAVPTG